MARQVATTLGDVEPKRCISIFRRQIGCLLEIRLRLRQGVAITINDAADSVGECIFSIALYRRTAIRDGAAVVAFSEVGAATVVIGRGRFGSSLIATL